MPNIIEGRQSLIDTANQHAIDMWVVFRNSDKPGFWLWKYLKPGFQHVECWKYIPPGAWLRFHTSPELIPVEVYAHGPWDIVDPEMKPTIVRARHTVPHGTFRAPFFYGPITCVELTKSFLGIGSNRIRTPYQLYKHLIGANKDV